MSHARDDSQPHAHFAPPPAYRGHDHINVNNPEIRLQDDLHRRLVAEQIRGERLADGAVADDARGGYFDRQKPSASGAATPMTPGSEIEEKERRGMDEGFDWSDEEGRAQEEKKRIELAAKEATRQRRTRQRRCSPYAILRFLTWTFLGNLVLAVMFITPAVLVRVLWAKDRADERRVFIADNVEAWLFWAAFNIFTAWAIHFIVELIPKLVSLIIIALWGELSAVLTAKFEVFDSAKTWLKPAPIAGAAWGAWTVIFTHIFKLRDGTDPANASRAPYTYRLFQVIEIVFFFCLVGCIEKLFLVWISLTYHRTAYAERIQKTSFALEVLDKLRHYRPKRKQAKRSVSGFTGFPPAPVGRTPTGDVASPSASDSWGRSIAYGAQSNKGTMSSHAEYENTDPSYSASRGKKRKSVFGVFGGRHGEQEVLDNSIPMSASTADQPYGSAHHSPLETPTAAVPARKAARWRRPHFRRYLKGRQADLTQLARRAMKDPISALSSETSLFAIATPQQARQLAKNIFNDFRTDRTRDFLIAADFYPAFSSKGTKGLKEAEEAFSIFDKDGNGDVSKLEIKEEVMNIYKERRLLARSLQDSSQAIGRLDACFIVLALLVIFFIALSVFEIDISSLLTSFYTLALGLAFIFKGAAQNLFDSIVFIFCTHPFDTGDRVFIDDDVFVIKKVGLLATVYTRWDATDVYISNADIANSRFITNVRRSGKMFENCTIQVGWKTTLDQLDELEAKMNKWLQTEELRMFEPSTAVVIQKLNYMRSMELTIGMMHKENWQDWGQRWARRNAFHAAIQHYCKELGITYYNSNQPVGYNAADLDEALRVPEDAFSDGDDEYEDDLLSPLSPNSRDDDGSSEDPTAKIEPLMGFVPPEGATMGLRKRKGNRKKALAAESGG